MYFPRAFAHQSEFFDAIARIRRLLPPEVVKIGATLGDDWSGEPAVFFMVILTDAATVPDRLLKVANEVQDRIVQEVEPLAKWDVLPYFNFRTKSEQEKLDRPAVA